jgi:CheY-like chemotaxis protein
VEEITVLCVDDDASLLMIHQMVLEASGYTVFTASSGPEALELFASGGNVDAVLLDYSMPKMDGGQVAALMKAMRPEVPVVMLSALPSLPENAQWVDAFVTKGQSPETWLVRLAGLLEQRQSAEFARGASARRFPAAA